MAARIISVTFETTTRSRPGSFSVPRAAANLLGIGTADAVELRITWEGRKLELSTSLRSGWEVYPRSTDETTVRLEAIPPSTPITVTVWRAGDASEDRAESGTWNDARFDESFASAGGPAELLSNLRHWAADHDVGIRYGRGQTAGPLYLDAPGTTPPITLMNVHATGGIEWVFRDNLDRARGLASGDTRGAFVRRISDLFGVDRADDRADTWLDVAADRLPRERYDELLQLLDEELELVASGRSKLRRKYQRFFTEVLRRFQELRPGVSNTKRVGTDNWHEFSAGKSGIRFTWSTAYRKYVRVELYIDVGQQSENKRIFDRLQDQADELEQRIGQPIAWERLDERRGSRIAVYGKTPSESFDSDVELIDWAAQTMARIVDVIRPEVARF
jgi:hypothetical protein